MRIPHNMGVNRLLSKAASYYPTYTAKPYAGILGMPAGKSETVPIGKGMSWKNLSDNFETHVKIPKPDIKLLRGVNTERPNYYMGDVKPPYMFDNTTVGTGGGPAMGPERSMSKSSSAPNFDNIPEGQNYTDPTGATTRLEGATGLAQFDKEWKARNPESALLNKYDPSSSQGKWAHKVGEWARNALDSRASTTLGGIMNKGPLAGAAAIGVPIGLLGMLGMYAKNKVTGSKHNALGWGATLGGAGLLAGGLVSHLRSKQASVMYTDPRNFILEKLQNDMNISAMEKASIAAAVRSMSQDKASTLAAMIRSAASVAVGALIAKFVFGSGALGMLLGGAAGYVGMNAINSALGGSSRNQSNGIPSSWIH